MTASPPHDPYKTPWPPFISPILSLLYPLPVLHLLLMTLIIPYNTPWPSFDTHTTRHLTTHHLITRHFSTRHPDNSSPSQLATLQLPTLTTRDLTTAHSDNSRPYNCPLWQLATLPTRHYYNSSLWHIWGKICLDNIVYGTHFFSFVAYFILIEEIIHHYFQNELWS
jgi:hypothetical protein